MDLRASIDTTLRETFRVPALRPGQAEVIESVCSGRPTVAIMPTGAGKSLCFQLPAVLLGGLTLVVSPLIALMKDQVDSLDALGVPAAALTSAMSAYDRDRITREMVEGSLRVVYVAPERFKAAAFEAVLPQLRGKLSLFAIDEAHCISEWGHDFRPDYKRLGSIMAALAPPRFVALTATATPEVREDIVRSLGLEDAAVFVRGFDRPNLHFAVEHLRGVAHKEERLVTRLKSAAGRPALVYAATRKNVERYFDVLKRARLSVGMYHAGLDDDDRTSVQDALMNDELQVVVATNAFGMGVDKSDVRQVIHADLPRSAEAYYQEAGRAGRDGEPAQTTLLFQYADVRLQEFLIDASTPSVELLRAVWRMAREHAVSSSDMGELRYGLGQVLGEKPSNGQLETAVQYLVRRGYLSDTDTVLVARTPDDPSQTIDAEALIRRARTEHAKLRRMVGYAYDGTCRRRYLLAYFGDAQSRSMRDCEACDVCTGQVVHPPGEAGAATGAPRKRKATKAAIPASAGAPDPTAVEKLRRFRASVAANEAVPAYCVFSNRTLEDLARLRPSTLDGLARVHGIGPERLERYGTQILRALAEA